MISESIMVRGNLSCGRKLSSKLDTHSAEPLTIKVLSHWEPIKKIMIASEFRTQKLQTIITTESNYYGADLNNS